MSGDERSCEYGSETQKPKLLRLSGSQPFTQQPGVFILIGERTNVAGSPKFARLIKEGKYEEAVALRGSRWRTAPMCSTSAWMRG
jgi:cobalamin-dependent methionine synthase I